MSSGERPIGAAKGKQSDTEALCPPPPLPHAHVPNTPPPLHHGRVFALCIEDYCRVCWCHSPAPCRERNGGLTQRLGGCTAPGAPPSV